MSVTYRETSACCMYGWMGENLINSSVIYDVALIPPVTNEITPELIIPNHMEILPLNII